MSAPLVLGVYGRSNSGKTTFIERLIRQLSKEGYKIATMKQTDKPISLDTRGKDTWRHRKAGAGLVVFSSAHETDFLVPKAMSASACVRSIAAFGSYDLVLVEGATDPAIPKIQIGAGKERKHTIAHYADNHTEILRFIRQQLKMKQTSQHLFITVNGKHIPLTEFPEHIMTNTIIGMLSSLKGVTRVDEATIQFRR